MIKDINERTLRIDLYFTHKHVESELELKDKNIVVIDVLRTSTTMVTGLANGAKEIIPTEDVATAGLIGRNSMGESLLCGERNGKLIEGFNLSNSVKEYSKENVHGKTLIFSSTNGTPAIMKSKFASICTIAGFVNISRIVDFVSEVNEDFILLCAGKLNEFCIEDTVCAGMLIEKLIEKNSKYKYELSDLSLGASKLYAMYKFNLLGMLLESEHGRYLTEIGFGDDLIESAKVDIYNCLPLLRNGMIRTLEAFETDPKLSLKKIGKST